MGRYPGVLVLLAVGFCGATTVKSVAPDSLEPYRQFMFSSQEDTLVNCDTASPVTALIRDHVGTHTLSQPGGKKGGNPWDGFRSHDFPVARFTFLKLAGDSLMAIGTLDKNPDPESYFPVCLDKKKLSAVYRIEDEQKKWSKGSHGGGGNGQSGVGLFVSGSLLALLLILLVLSS